MRQVYAPDSVGNELYIVGRIILDTSAFWYPLNPVMRYSGGAWDTLSYVQWGFIESIVVYHDTLIIGGNFNFIEDGSPCEGILYWANGAWHPFGNLEHQVRKLRVLDDTLYATGGFHNADGLPTMGIARRVGGQWVPVGTVQEPDVLMLDVIKYQGRLVAIGNGYINGLRGIFQFEGNQWSAPGPWVRRVAFRGGMFSCLSRRPLRRWFRSPVPRVTLRPGDHAKCWDGSSFHAVGTGLQWELGNLYSFSTCTDMKVHDGLLWVCGGFNYAGGVEAHGVATWNGTNWCGVHGDFTSSQNGYVSSMDFYGDTLFVACGDTADGQYVNNSAKFIGVSYVDTCGSPVGLSENNGHARPLVLLNSVAYSGQPLHLTVDGSVSSILLYSSEGRLVKASQVQGPGSIHLGVDALASGTYIVVGVDDSNIPVARLKALSSTKGAVAPSNGCF